MQIKHLSILEMVLCVLGISAPFLKHNVRDCWLFSTQEPLGQGLLLVIHIMLQMQAFCMATSVGGVSGEGSGLVGSSSQSQVNTYLAFNPALMSDNHSNHFFSPSF